MANSVQVFNGGILVATYGTIQAAIDAPTTLAGSILIASAGTYAEHVVLSKAVTLSGANDGVDGAEARGAETVITGGVKIAADGVTVDGVKISGSYDTSGTPDLTSPPHIGLLIGGAEATIVNSVLTGNAVSSAPFSTSGSATNLAFDHNLVQDWTQAAYLTAGSTGSITHNTFADNGGGVFSERMSAFDVSHNSFSGSTGGADVGGNATSPTFAVGDFVHDNTYSSTVAQPVSVYLTGPNGQVVDGSDDSTVFHLENHTGAATVHGGAGNDAISYEDAGTDVTIDLNAGTSSTTGSTATFTSIENAIGGSGNDTITGDSGDNTLIGNAGNDSIYGLAGNDKLEGDAGDDTLYGGPGDDTLDGGLGSDTASYADYDGDPSGVGSDTLLSIENATGTPFNDILVGNNSANILSGLAGDDTLLGRGGNDTLDGGDGTDTASYSDAGSGVTVSLVLQGSAQNTVGAGSDTLISIENLTGSAFNDTLTGDDNANTLSGLAGNDTLTGGAGNDTLDGGDGTDTANYSDAGSGVNVSLVLQGSAQDTGGAGSDTLVDIENLTGSAFNDTLTGDANANTLSGLAGDDTLNGGAGNDTLDGGDGTDTASYSGAGSGVAVSLALQGSAQDTVGAGSDTLVNIENLTGSAFNDTLTGDGHANVLTGGGGDDTLDGGAGSDTASYSDAGSGVTVSLASQGSPQDTGGAGSDTLTNIENLTGSAFNDTLTGDANANVLTGGAGNDKIDGGDGTDTAVYSGSLTAANFTAVADADPDSPGNQPGWQVSGGPANGTDLLTGVEKVSDGAGHNFLLVGSGGYDTIQEAIDAASPGDTIEIAAGTYDEHVIIDKAVTLLGANAGIDGKDEARGPETIITGGVNVGTGGATIDGVEIKGSSFEVSIGTFTGLLIGGPNVTIENSVLTGDDLLTSSAFNTSAVATSLSFDHNLVQDWNSGATLGAGSSGSITQNTFIDSGGIFSLGMSFEVSDNSFSGSTRFDVGGRITSATLDIADVVHDNSYSLGLAQPIYVEVSGPDGQVVDGSDTPTTFQVTTHGGQATVHGGAGSDTISYSGANSPATIDLAAGTSSSLSGTVTFTSIENATGGFGSDTITGDSGDNTLVGNDGDDSISGLAGNDKLDGGDGNDMLNGGAGDDTLDGGAGSDTASYSDAGSGVTVSLALQGSAQDTAGAGSDTLVSIENLTGSAFNDTLTGDANANTLSGLAGDDTLQGGAGNDILDGGAGNDTASYEDAASGVKVSLGIGTEQDTIGAGSDTLTNMENLTGSAFDDMLGGDANANTISGLAGDDTLNGGAGNDTLDGGDGNDIASYVDAASGVNVSLALQGSAQDTGGAGSDTLVSIENLTGSTHDDTLTGDANANVLNGGAGDDTLDGGAGDDTVYGGTGNDTASYADASSGVNVSLELQGSAQDTGGAGNDTLINIDNLIGSAFDDTLTGDANANTLSGLDGDDTLQGGAGNDTLDGGTGNDTASYEDAASGVTVDLTISTAQNTVGAGSDTLVSIENLTGSAFDDTLTGDDNANTLSGLDGNDTLQGGAGNDTLDGGDGTDTASYADAASGVTVSLALQGSAQDTGGAGSDTLSNIESLTGSAHDDTLTGDANANTLSGLAGDDTLNGGAGDDTLDGGDGTDTASYSDAASGVTVSLALQLSAQDTVGAGSDTLSNIENLTGSAHDDTLTGDGNANTLSGLAGDDTLQGGAGNDTLDGGAGNDTASYEDAAGGVTVSLAIGTAQDTIGAGTDTLTNIENLTGSAYDDTLTGDGNANTLKGLDGNDTLNGGGGNDTLDGGDGTDTASYVDATSAVTVSLALDTAQNTVGAGTDTLANIENLTGSAFADTLTGDDNNNVISGLAGNDTLEGGAGDDTLDGGGGTDTASYAHAGSAVTVSLAVATAQDTGGAGSDTLTNFENLTGSAFDDTLTGDAGANTLKGLDGDDTLQGGAGNDALDGGDGTDTASYADAGSGVTVSLAIGTAQDTIGAGTDTLANIENLTGSGHNDTLTGDAGANVLAGGAGDDTLTGGAGDDTLDGGDGIDTAHYTGTVTVTATDDGWSVAGGTGEGTDTLSNIEIVDDAAGGKILLVGNGGYATIQAAFDAAAAGDTIQIAPGDYSGSPATTAVDGLIVSAPADATGIAITLGGTIHDITLLGDSDIDVTGNGFDNVITGNDGNNSLSGLGGNDTLTGGAGDDTLDGGDGTDTASYGDAAGAVTVNLAEHDSQDTGGAGSDTLTGIENLTGSGFNDALTGDEGNNTLSGLGGDDTLQGGAGNDTLIGGAGSDTASYIGAANGVTVTLATQGASQNTIGAGTDTLISIENLTGSAHDDTLAGDANANVLDGGDNGDGGDTVSYAGAAGGVTVSLALDIAQNTIGAGTDTLSNFENLTGSTHDDTLTGDDNNNTILGLAGNDTLNGGNGDDILDGGVGTDTASYFDADSGVTVSLAEHDSQDTGGAGSDTLTGIENLTGSAFADTLTGDENANVLSGLAGDDTLNGGAGNDTLDGGIGNDTASYEDAANGVTVSLATQGASQDTIGAGTDTLISIENLTGSAHDDTLAGDANANVLDGGDNGDGGDTVSYAGAAGGVTVSLALDIAQNTIGAGTDTLSNFENLTGSTHDDTLTGDDNNNTILGLAGNDTLNGGNGDDILDGGVGTDTASYFDADSGVTVSLAEHDSQDTGGAGSDTLTGIENLTGSAFADTLTGDENANVLSGLAGDDTLNGGAGNDTLDGGAGSDTASYEDAASGVTVSLATQGASQNTIGAGTDTLISIENLTGSAHDDTLAGDANANVLDGGDNGDGGDTVSYAGAAGGVTVSLALDIAQNTIGAGTDTLSNFENLTGSTHDDTLTGDDNNNTILGLAGNDTLNGGNGDDILDGGVGTDTASYFDADSGVTVSLAEHDSQDTGGAGSDTLTGIENLTGSTHDDILTGDANANVLSGLAGDDLLNGGAGNDTLDGGTGNDTATYEDAAAGVTVSLAITTAQDTVGAGTDTLTGIENLIGSAFGDTLSGDANANVLDGGDGVDTVSYAGAASAVTVSLALQDGQQDTIGAGSDTLTGFENLTGSAFNDILTGDDNNNTISGGAGNDTLSGGNGDDTLDGGTGTDTATYVAADSGVTVSLMLQGSGQDTGGAGSDTLIGIENLTGSAHDDTLSGDAGNNVLDGGGNDDGGVGDTASYADATAGVTVSLALQGSAQNTVGAGSDTLSNFENLTGSAFNDILGSDSHDNILDGGDGNDTASYAAATGAVTVDLTQQDSQQDTVNAGNDTLISIENVTGSNFNDTLIGDLNNNTLTGGGGNDMLIGSDGNDSLDGGTGTDTVSYEDAGDAVTVNLALSSATGGAGTDTLANIENVIGSSSFDDNLTGNAADNVLQGLDGADTLNGGAGNDTLDGGDGDGDTASYVGASSGVTVSLAIAAAQNTIGAGVDTLIGIENLTGSALNDTLTGDANANILDGGAGNDTLNGGAGDDNLLGGAGNDTLMGGAGDDIMDGGAAGSDTASYADAGSAVTVDLNQSDQDTIGAGFDTLINFENLTGSAFNDTLTGNGAANILNGGAGNDILNAGAGNDSLIGGAGNDTLIGGAGNDVMDGAAGSDTASYADATAGVTVSLAITTAQNTVGSGSDTLTNIENLTGSNFNDTLTGNTAANILNGGAGNDTLNGGAGNDSLIGAAGSDTASYADATAGVTVNLAIAAAQNTIGAGVDTLATIENLTGSNFNDTLTGSTAANILNGGAGNDTLAAGAGNDSLIGGAGNDTLNGGAGNDSMDGGAAGSDTASYADAAAGVTVNLAIGIAQNTIGAGVDTLVNFENLTGSAFNDTLTGNAGANVLSGLAGNDTLKGGAGNDTLTGAAGNDILNGGAGNDHMDGGAAGSDTASYADATAGVKVSLAIGSAQITGGSGTDTLLNFENLTGSNFNDKLSGNAAANTLGGLGGNDSLNGAAGIDTLSGGAGNDRLIGGAGNDNLDGGAGTDSFVFDKAFGKDIVTGFVAAGAGHDTIDFSTAVFANFAAVHSHMAQSGANVIITLDSADTITLKNVTVASLTAADFTFHPGTAPAAPAQAAAAAWAAHGAEANSHFHFG